MSEELKEWLGIKPADLVVYAAAGALIWMYYSKNMVLDVVLSVAAVLLCILSCVLGMKSDDNVSGFTNLLKKLAYPGCLIAALVCIYLNFTRWNVRA